MKKMKMEPPNKCQIRHRWELVKDTGAIKYHKCKDCGARFARSTSDGYQPINYRWVTGLDDSL